MKQKKKCHKKFHRFFDYSKVMRGMIRNYNILSPLYLLILFAN